MQEKITLLTPDVVELTLTVAGVGSRSYAFLIDWSIRALLAGAWLMGVVMVFGIGIIHELVADGAGDINPSLLLAMLPALVVYLGYHPVLEIVMHGRTPGKRIAGIRIVTAEGAVPGFGTLLTRNAFRAIDALPFFYVIGLGCVMLTARQVRIGDLAAGTLLVYEERVPHHVFELSTEPGQRITASQALILHDLLERWPKLGTAARVRLAIKFLRRARIPAPVDDEMLHARLIGLLEESHARHAP